jgi:hypothetical protein
MAKGNLLDDLARGFKDFVKDLERMLNPNRQPQRVRVPIPVRSRHPQDRSPYNR